MSLPGPPVQLTPDNQERFAEAASTVLAQRELMEMLAGTERSPSQLERLDAAGEELMRLTPGS